MINVPRLGKEKQELVRRTTHKLPLPIDSFKYLAKRLHLSADYASSDVKI